MSVERLRGRHIFLGSLPTLPAPAGPITRTPNLDILTVHDSSNQKSSMSGPGSSQNEPSACTMSVRVKLNRRFVECSGPEYNTNCVRTYRKSGPKAIGPKYVVKLFDRLGRKGFGWKKWRHSGRFRPLIKFSHYRRPRIGQRLFGGIKNVILRFCCLNPSSPLRT